MARRAPSFSQADVTRLIKGALAAGVAMERIAGVQSTKDGPLLLLAAPGESALRSGETDLDRWRRDNGPR